MLCPGLYARLEERFDGGVIVANEGESLVFGFGQQALTGNRVSARRELIQHRGESYRVCCNKCGDTKHRLWVNHRFAEFRFLVKCYNENCYSSPEERDQLYLWLFRTRAPVKLTIRRGRSQTQRLRQVDWPGPVFPLQDLPLTHPANTYLESRGFDPHLLGRMYGLVYCEKAAEAAYHRASGRILIPIVMRGVRVGWQGRFVGERHWKTCPVPKYWDLPGMPKRLMLYNHDLAAAQPFVVLQEGVTDVWNTGPWAVSLLGHEITYAQKRILEFPPFRDKPIIMMLDGDAYIENEATAAELRSGHEAGVVRVDLPGDMDPGDLRPEVNLELIYQAAAAQGVHLPEVQPWLP